MPKQKSRVVARGDDGRYRLNPAVIDAVIESIIEHIIDEEMSKPNEDTRYHTIAQRITFATVAMDKWMGIVADEELQTFVEEIDALADGAHVDEDDDHE